ncbi:MAG TPA: T9SS type A sorting domain-containing protein, partial [Candidatus Marinimicrobia bacterium]|nr:T9SS type A sorting domain-containing protein [Candidatus Neomarinimicrobiota bacterium]
DDEAGWQVAIEAQSGDYFDRYNRFGCLESASNELDWHDNPEMAPMGNHISMYFNSIIESSVVPMTSDLRQTMDQVQIWDGEISGSGLTEPVEISWHVEKAPPGDIAVNLIDLNTRRVLDLAAPDQYLLGDLDDRYSRQIKIVAGDPGQVALAVDEILATIPEELSLDGNYPNPFNPVTTIRFGLPEPRKIRITVVNILGQEVTELVNGWRDMGHHEVVWQGVDGSGKAVATGMYFTVLSDGNKIIVQKMLLLK